jgi:type VI protein secretion system component Hcp
MEVVQGALMKFRGILLAASFALCSLLATGRAQAQSIFLEISGVPGEVTTPAAFAGQINVLALSWGGTKVCTGALNLQSLSFTKNTDKASTVLLAALRDHTVYPTITFRFVRTDGQVYQSYVLTNAVAESISMGGSAAETRTTENVTMAFSQVTATYTFIDAGGKVGATSSTTVVAGPCP